MNKQLTFTPWTGLDVAKLLGPEAEKAYMDSKENRLQNESKMKKDLTKVFEMFKKIEDRK